jgi:L-ribulose-5-phosphate 3-epimerase
MNRRATLKKIMTAGGLGLMAGELQAISSPFSFEKNANGPDPFYLFSKVLQWMPLADVPKAVKDMGFDGIDLPVRRNGFFDTPDLKTKLPKVVSESANLGLKTPVLTTDMNIGRMAEMDEFLKTLAGEGHPTLPDGVPFIFIEGCKKRTFRNEHHHEKCCCSS